MVNSLTRKQRSQVDCYLHFKDKPMSVAALFWFNRRIYALILVVGLLSVGFAYWVHDSYMLVVFVVAYTTIILRDAAYYWRSHSVWPVLQETLSWEQLQRMAADTDIAT